MRGAALREVSGRGRGDVRIRFEAPGFGAARNRPWRERGERGSDETPICRL